MKKFVLPGLLLVALGIVTWLYLEKSGELADASARFETERQELRKEFWDLNKRLRQLEGELAAAKAGAPAAPATATPRGGDNGRGALAGNLGQLASQILGNMTRSLDSPEARRLIAMQQRAQLDGRYADLFKSLNLPPDQLDRLKTLLVDRQSAAMDVLSVANAQGINPLTSPEAIRDLARETQARVDGDIRSLLGDQGFAQYQGYEQTLPQRAVADQLEQRLSYSSTPLSPEQHEQVVQLLATTSPAPAGNEAADFTLMTNAVGFVGNAGGNLLSMGGPVAPSLSAPINNDAVARASTVLSAPQVAALQQLQQEQQAQRQMGGTMQRSVIQNLGGRGAAGAGGRRGGN